jgi:replicative DNA helicase
MSSLKDSGDIEQDGDLLLMLYRDEYYKAKTEDNGVIEVIVGKNRNGATGTCKASTTLKAMTNMHYRCCRCDNRSLTAGVVNKQYG